MKNTSLEELSQMRIELSRVTEPRSVQLWNEMREGFKAHFSQNAISMLDSGGYITKWLKGNEL
jgi:hypothetical protein